MAKERNLKNNNQRKKSNFTPLCCFGCALFNSVWQNLSEMDKNNNYNNEVTLRKKSIRKTNIVQ